MKNAILFQVLILLLACNSSLIRGQNITLQTCFSLAHSKNLLIRQSQHGVQAKKYALAAEKLSILPTIDLLAGYNYLSNPLTINLQTVKNGVVLGSSQQSVYTANAVFQQITGQNLPGPVQQEIYNSSKNIIETAYPDYNPELSQQQYFTAGLFVRQPIWLGGKLGAARNVAATELKSGIINQQVVENELDFIIALQYIRILYLNTLLALNKETVTSFEKNENFVAALVKNNMIPPYYQNWTKVLLVQARSRQNNTLLDKQNALREMNRLLGVPEDTVLSIEGPLRYDQIALQFRENNQSLLNPLLLMAGNNTLLARTNIKGARSLLLPNFFGVANINLYQKDLPVTTPPWMVGVELQWSLFDGFKNYQRVQVTKQIAEEASLMEENTRTGINTKIVVALNRLKSLQQDIATLDSARSEAKTTTTLIGDRARNNFSSPKDINDAMVIQEEIEKTYYTAVYGYYIALTEYFNLTGASHRITEYLN
ncbi:MAG: TolC family protein [Bacteroidales bacterium]|jgi:outer membrane protein TolC|nr:TolC family protein [Bacteroidales bacterium]